MPSDAQAAALLKAADVVGGLMEAWGFKRNMGRMWATLYLSPKPLSAAELCEKLSLSTGAVSMTLSDLSKWGVVRKTWVPGERRDYYEPETSIWKMVSGVFRQRELQLIRRAIEAFDEAIEALEPAGKTTEFAVERIRGLLSLAKIGENLLSSVLSGKPIDAGPLAGFEPK